MRHFHLVVDDDRYAVPQMRFLVVGDVMRALRAADRLIDESSHHRGVEVSENGRRLFGLGSRATPPRGGEAAAAQPLLA